MWTLDHLFMSVKFTLNFFCDRTFFSKKLEIITLLKLANSNFKIT